METREGLQCPIKENHFCVALQLYKKYSNDYPESPCKTCDMDRIVELEEKLKGDKHHDEH